MIKRKKIVVAMSGGVDSSTIAAMMLEAGYEVIGVTLKLCNNSVSDAQNVAKQLGIEHHVRDLSKEFSEQIISYFTETYLAGKTPNPCAKCNKEIKFGLLYDFAMKLGADALATGHYVRKLEQNGEIQLHKAKDLSKDQSYFLFAVDKQRLKHIEFPLGLLKKSEVRKLAKSYGLIVAEKPESQDICFVPNGNYACGVAEHASSLPGNILDMSGNVIGRHKGLIHYTIGQRRGVGLSGSKEPCYVVKMDADTNSIIVGSKHDLESTEFYIEDTNWFVETESLTDQAVTVKIRSTHEGSEARLSLTKHKDKYLIKLLNPCSSVTPGQACVVYDGSRLLGGGIIC